MKAAAAAVMHVEQVSTIHGQIFHRALFRPVVYLKCDLFEIFIYIDLVLFCHFHH